MFRGDTIPPRLAAERSRPRKSSRASVRGPVDEKAPGRERPTTSVYVRPAYRRGEHDGNIGSVRPARMFAVVGAGRPAGDQPHRLSFMCRSVDRPDAGFLDLHARRPCRRRSASTWRRSAAGCPARRRPTPSGTLHPRSPDHIMASRLARRRRTGPTARKIACPKRRQATRAKPRSAECLRQSRLLRRHCPGPAYDDAHKRSRSTRRQSWEDTAMSKRTKRRSVLSSSPAVPHLAAWRASWATGRTPAYAQQKTVPLVEKWVRSCSRDRPDVRQGADAAGREGPRTSR